MASQYVIWKKRYNPLTAIVPSNTCIYSVSKAVAVPWLFSYQESLGPNIGINARSPFTGQPRRKYLLWPFQPTYHFPYTNCTTVPRYPNHKHESSRNF